MSVSGARPILVVDHDPAALALTRQALRRAGIRAPLEVKEDSRAAIGYLQDRLERGEATLPLLIFLDLQPPRGDGVAVLDWIRGQPRLRRLLTVVLSASAAAGERAATAGGRSLFQLAHAMMSVDEIERLVLPGIQAAAGAPA